MKKEASIGDTVIIHYTGQLEDGTIFDTSTEGEPLQFTIGRDQVIPGRICLVWCFPQSFQSADNAFFRFARSREGEPFGLRYFWQFGCDVSKWLAKCGHA